MSMKGAGKRRIGALAVSYDSDREAAQRRAHEQFRWSTGEWKVMAELPSPAASRRHRGMSVRRTWPSKCHAVRTSGPMYKAVRKFVDAGYTHVALAQVGGDHQEDFIRSAEKELLPVLRSL